MPIRLHSCFLPLLLAALSLLSGCTTPRTIADLAATVDDHQLIIYPAGQTFSRSKWIFDTGASISVLDKNTFASLPVEKTAATLEIQDGIGNSASLPLYVLHELPLKQRGTPTPFVLNDVWVAKVPNLRRNTGFDAILGFRPFADHILQLNLGQNRIRILDQPPARHPGVVDIPLHLEEWRPIVGLRTADGHAIPALVDTGMNGWFAFTKPTLNALGLNQPGARSQITSFLGKNRLTNAYRYPGSIRIGHAAFDNMQIKESYGENILGIAPLRHFRLTLDPRNRRAAVDLPRIPWSRLGFPPAGYRVRMNTPPEEPQSPQVPQPRRRLQRSR